MYTKNCEITYDNWRKSMLEAKKNCEENDVAPAEAFHQFSLLFNAKRKLFEFVNKVENNDENLRSECKEIYEIIDSIVFGQENDKFLNTLYKNTQLYRARRVRLEAYSGNEGIDILGDKKISGYDEVNSREPLLGIPDEGRNNIAGVSYLYVASNPETACVEVKSQLGDVISLATFETKEEIKIVDFTYKKDIDKIEYKGMDINTFFSQLMFQYSKPVGEKGKYKVTQIISDYLRKTGIDGVAYNSFYCPGGVNYTFFNSHPKKLEFKESRLLIHKQALHSFWDLNEEQALYSDNHLIEYDKKIADEQRKKIMEYIGNVKRKNQ